MKTRTAIRKENLAALVDVHGQAAVADKIGKDRNQVYQWLQEAGDKAARNISDRSAALIEDAFGKPRGWLDQENVLRVGEGHEPYLSPSQPGRPDLEKISGAVRILYDWLELMEEPPQGVYDSIMLGIAYGLVESSSEPVTDSNVLQFVKQFKHAIKGGQNGHRSMGGSGS